MPIKVNEYHVFFGAECLNMELLSLSNICIARTETMGYFFSSQLHYLQVFFQPSDITSSLYCVSFFLSLYKTSWPLSTSYIMGHFGDTIAMMSCQSPWCGNERQPSSKSITLIQSEEEKFCLVSVLLPNLWPCEWFMVPVVLLLRGGGHCTGTCNGCWTHVLWTISEDRDRPQPPPHWEPLQAGQH